MSYPLDFQYYLIKPELRLSHTDQIHFCISQLRALQDEAGQARQVIRINWFYRLSGQLNCGLIRQYISFSGTARVFSVTPSYIAQAPTDGSDMEVLVTMLRGSGVSYREAAGIRYAVYTDSLGSWLYAGGSACITPSLTCRKQSANALTLARDILEMEKMTFRNVLRQWNFIGDILEQEVTDKGLVQNYQEFNEMRRKWYDRDAFDRDYPAATGIGTRGGGVRIEFIATSLTSPYSIYSLKNPAQHDAHSYSRDQLVGALRQSTPKFERGKLVCLGEYGYLWVSGTAAIRGESSVPGTAMDQARVTCQNIDLLISAENLKKSGCPDRLTLLGAVYIRGYVKHMDDGPAVADYLRETYPDALIQVLQADVCRSELLVEVEAEFRLGIS